MLLLVSNAAVDANYTTAVSSEFLIVAVLVTV